jgi:riboflavin synthase
MFSGIVQAVGRIVRTRPLEIESRAFDRSDLRVGDSVCVQGVCLTVTRRTARGFRADVSRETLAVTTGLDAPGVVNLEKALALGDRLGGHLVTGHVDGVGTVVAFEPAGKSRLLRVRAPRALARYIARKGSITVDGVSLTVNRVRGALFEVNLIPHTLAATTLGRLAKGAKVNLEVDLIARYLERLGRPRPSAR